MCPIEARDAEVPMPGSPVWFFDVDVGECLNYPSDQQLAKVIQQGLIAGHGCTIVGGKGYTSLTLSQVATLCFA